MVHWSQARPKHVNYQTVTIRRHQRRKPACFKKLWYTGYRGIDLNGADILNKLPRLSSSDESKARTIALADERIRELVQGKDYEITLTTRKTGEWWGLGTPELTFASR